MCKVHLTTANQGRDSRSVSRFLSVVVEGAQASSEAAEITSLNSSPIVISQVEPLLWKVRGTERRIVASFSSRASFRSFADLSAISESEARKDSVVSA